MKETTVNFHKCHFLDEEAFDYPNEGSKSAHHYNYSQLNLHNGLSVNLAQYIVTMNMLNMRQKQDDYNRNLLLKSFFIGTYH